MSADGEVSVAVTAEGTEDAAAELSDADPSGGAAAGGGGGMGGGGGLKQSLKGGLIGGLLSQLLGPLLDVLSPILGILRAFLAPLAVFLLRLFQPVLRLLIGLLPAWMSFIDTAMQGLPKLIAMITSLPGDIWNFVSSLPGMIWDAISSGASWLANGAVAIGSAVWSALSSGASWLATGASSIGTAVWDTIKSGASWITNGAQSIGSAVWGFMKSVFTTVKNHLSNVKDDAASLVSHLASLPGDIWTEIKGLAGMITRPVRNAISQIPGVDISTSDGTTTNANTPQGGTVAATGQGQERTNVMISGGLSPFVSSVERSSQVDF